MIKVVKYTSLDVDLLSQYSGDVYIPYQDDIDNDVQDE